MQIEIASVAKAPSQLQNVQDVNFNKLYYMWVGDVKGKKQYRVSSIGYIVKKKTKYKERCKFQVTSCELRNKIQGKVRDANTVMSNK